MSLTLPERPHLSHLKAQAKDLLTAYRTGDTLTRERTLPYFSPDADFGLNEAQLVIAREYGFDSWAKLKQHVELRSGDVSLIEEANRLAALAMGREREAISTRLAERPELSRATLAAACATGEVEAVATFLKENPEQIRQKVGDKGWEPLLYTCYSCLLQDDFYRPRLLETASWLLEAGADPNAHWLNPEWDNSPEPCLYGATGVNNSPKLAELLLKAGANPNDNESLYHSTELPDPTCLKLLLDYGGDVGHGNALPRLLDHEKPEWVRMMLGYAKDKAQIPPCIPHALRRGRAQETFQALVDSGVPLNTRDENNLTPYQSAIRLGRSDVAEILAKAGAETNLTEADTLLGRLSRGETVDSTAISPAVIQLLDSEKSPELVRQAERGNNVTLEILLAAGANPNVRDSQTTPLHQAALHGRLETIRILLRHGADPTILDSVHNGHAVGWACFASENTKSVAPETYVEMVRILLDAGGIVPETAWGSPEVQAFLMERGAKSPG